jgi:hypothetical protein
MGPKRPRDPNQLVKSIVALAKEAGKPTIRGPYKKFNH